MAAPRRLRSFSLVSIAIALVVSSGGCTSPSGGAGVTGLAARDERAERDPAAAPPRYSVTFRGRVIDLEPFLIGFPYSGHIADLEHAQIFYFERTPEGRWMHRQRLSRRGTIDHARGARLTDIDWSTRSFFGGEYHDPSDRLFVSSDEANDEHINVYAIDVETGAIEQITHNDYTYGWSFSDDGRYLGYLARHGETEPFDTALHVRDLETGEDREILRDGGGKDRFTWSAVKFTEDNRSVIVTVQHDGQRNTKSLARVDLTAANPELEYLHPPRVLRYSLGQVEGWVDEGRLLFTSAEEGFSNLYVHDLDSAETVQITDFEDELRSVALLDTKPSIVLAVLGRPHESVVLTLDARTGRELSRETVPATVSILDAHGTDALLSQNSLETPWQGKRLQVSRSGNRCRTRWSDFGGIPESLEAKISHYKVERVAYPTFDALPDGSPRLLHGFLLAPKNPPARPEDRLVRITSFYGGSNRFDTSSQILAAAGIATFSPAPRGSSGFGAEFAALNDGDLGGDEIVDILYAARWLVKEKGYEPHQIGVYGGSHGGYATMRALTFPPQTNGRDEHFAFGFGWSHAGFSDILTFYDSCNIPDWVVKEAGDPSKEAAKLRDRSPLYHVERLESPILLTHGSNDWRVPVDESRRFAARARELGKPVVYVEFEGQGHGIRGFENLVRYYQTALTFLENLEEHRRAAPPPGS